MFNLLIHILSTLLIRHAVTGWGVVRRGFSSNHVLSERTPAGETRPESRRSVLANTHRRQGRTIGLAILFTLLATQSYGYFVNNTASVNYIYSSVAETYSSNLVSVNVPPPPSVASAEFLHFNADPLGTVLPATDFGDNNPPGIFTAMLPNPGPGIQTIASDYLEGELVVVRINDADQNLDPLTPDTLQVALDVLLTGDSELLRLTETGVNTGIFEGYIYAGTTPVGTFDGYLTAPATSQVALTYDDGGTNLSLSVPVLASSTSASLWLQLQADRTLIAPGDLLGYTLTIENTDPASAAPAVIVTQTLPSGFVYQPGSARLAGTLLADPSISADGRTLSFPVGDLPAGANSEISFLTMVGAVTSGSYPSDAVANTSGAAFSNTADDTVFVRDPFGADRSHLAGRVLHVNSCEETHFASGVAGIRLFLEDGTFVMTDAQGRYHIEGLEPGTHVVQLDPVTIPDGHQAALCEDHTRSANNPASRFIETQPGSLWRADFYLTDIPLNGEATIALNNVLEIGEAATYTVSLSGKGIPMQRQRLDVELPGNVEYLPESALLDGRKLQEPTNSGRTITFVLPDRSEAWQSTVTFRTLVINNGEEVEMRARARLHFDTLGHNNLATPFAESALIWVASGEHHEVQELLLQPKFDTLNAALSERDQEALNATIDTLKALDLIKIYVIGHTDARRIRWNNGIAYRDNFELSEARAEAVVQQLLDALALDPEQLVSVGMGAADPISDNQSAEGMADNRRTDLRVIHRVKVEPDLETINSVNSEPQTLIARARPNARPLAREPLPAGILSLADGDALADPVHAVRVRIDERLTPKLLLDGIEIPAERIGFSMSEPENKTILLTYIGVNFIEPGEHTLTLQGIGPFGNVRYEDQVTILRTGGVAEIDVLATDDNVADGRTPIKVRLQLRDERGEIIQSHSKLEIRSGNLIPLNAHDGRLPSTPEEKLVMVDGDGWAAFEPVDQSGLYRVTLGHGDTEVNLDIFVAPEQRDWILVGLASGSAGTQEILDGIEPLPDGTEDGYYDEGRLAFFARGQVKGDWLLTVAYDSDKADRRNQSLHQVIDPDSYYTLYGDTTSQGYAAASAEKLYLRIERERFYAMFGDLSTGLNVTELSRYTRSLTGFKSEYAGRAFGYKAFVSETEQGYVRDEIRGDGTSGLYRLTQTPLVMNSEKVTLETRDRFHSETLIESRTLQRHLDYNIDYADGSLYFKEPVASRDDNFNPITIVVEYETHQLSSDDLTYGGRAYVRALGDALELGASAIHEGADAIESDLYGLDAEVTFGKHLTLRGEWATSTTQSAGSEQDGDAWLAETHYTSKHSDLRLYAREQQGSFGLGQQAASESGTRKLGGDFSLRMTRPLELSGQLFTQENLASDTERLVAEGQVHYRQQDYSLSAGLRHANDEQTSGDDETSNQLILGGELQLSRKLSLLARHDQSLSDNDNRDYPTRTLIGADYDLTRAVALFVRQEFTQGETADSEGTRIGLRATPWDGAQMRTSVEQQVDENGERTYANLGLSQSWQATPKLGLDISLDRSQTLSGSIASPLHPEQPPAAGTPEEFTAVSSGLSYRETDWTMEGRAEYRDGESEDRWGLFAGSIVEPRRDLGLSFSVRFARSDRQDNNWSHDAELRFGLAHRPSHRSWLLLDRLDLIYNADDDGSNEDEGWRIVNRVNVHWRATHKAHVAVNSGIRYVAEELDGYDFDTLTTLFGGEIRYDFTPRWDLGLHASSLNAWDAAQALYRSGVSVGFSPAKNLWLSLGYNFTGFSDKDFSAGDYTAQGGFLRFRVKFDQQSVREAVELFAK